MKLLAGLAVIVTLISGLTVVSLASTFKAQEKTEVVVPLVPGSKAGTETTVADPNAETQTSVTISESQIETQVKIKE